MSNFTDYAGLSPGKRLALASEEWRMACHDVGHMAKMAWSAC
jgi:hypothetical protein